MELPAIVCNNIWQAFADRHVDAPHETQHLYAFDGFFNAEDVKPFETVFVKTDLLDSFIRVLRPRIRGPFQLITGHSDLSPSDFAIHRVMNDPGIVRWAAQNCTVETYKLSCLPMGLSEPDRAIGDQSIFVRASLRAAALPSKRAEVALPYTGSTHPMRTMLARAEVTEHPLVDAFTSKLPLEEYLDRVADCAYCLCPRGNAIDCHRVYESILMRTVPIYIGDAVPACYRRLPVLVLHPASLDGLLDLLASLPPAPPPDHPSWARAIDMITSENALQKWS